MRLRDNFQTLGQFDLIGWEGDDDDFWETIWFDWLRDILPKPTELNFANFVLEGVAQW